MAEVKNDNTIEIVEQKEAKAENEPAIEGMGFDEYLARTVQKYPVIYDKSCKDFHDRDVKDNAWQTVAREVGLLSGQDAEKQFRLLRDRYQRAKMSIQRKETVTKSPVAMVRVQTRLTGMNYLQWLDDHIKPRTRLVSVRGNRKSVMDIIDSEDVPSQVEILDGGDCASEVESELDYSGSSVPNTMVPTKRKLSPPMVPQHKMSKTATQTRMANEAKRQYHAEEDSKHSSFDMRESCNLLRESDDQKALFSPDIRNNITVIRDSAQIFGDFVADQLRQLTREQAIEAKYKISGIFYSLMHHSSVD